jgi:ankyrin repeat protein
LRTVEEAITSASVTSAEISSLSGEADGYGDSEQWSDADSGFGEGSTTGSHEGNHRPIRLTTQNLSMLNDGHPTARPQLFSGLPMRIKDSGRDPFDSSSSSESGATIRDGIPGDIPNNGHRHTREGDEGDEDDDSEIESVVSHVESAYMVRDTLERLSAQTTSSVALPAENPTVEVITQTLRDLQKIMVEIRRGASNPEAGPAVHELPDLLNQIEELFTQVRRNFPTGANEDDRILNGSNIAITNSNGETALHIAARKCAVDDIRRLIRLGASVHDLDCDGNTPLFSLLSRDKYPRGLSMEIYVPLLLGPESDVNFSLQNRLTALHHAAGNADAVTVDILLSRGASANAVTQLLQTPLHVLCNCRIFQWYSREPSIVADLLFRDGADAQMVDCNGRRPLDLSISLLLENEGYCDTRNCTTQKKFLEMRQRLESCLFTIGVLLSHLPEVTLHGTSRVKLLESFTFRDMHDIERMPIAELRHKFHSRQVEILLARTSDLFIDLKRFVRSH